MSRIQNLHRGFTGTGNVRKQPRVHNGRYLDFVRSLPSLINFQHPVEAAHIRFAEPAMGKRPTGIQEKPSDRWVVPLTPELHRSQHGANEREWWKARGIDPLRVAAALYGAFHEGDREAAEWVVRMAGTDYLERNL